MKKNNMMAVIAAVALLLSGCADAGRGGVARLAERLAPQLLTVLGPTAAALLGPEVGQVVNLLQSRGAVAVERAADAKLAAIEDRILRGEIATPPAAQEAYDKASARMKLLRQLRKGNDYSQMVRSLSVPARAALELSRATVDARYEAVRVALVDLGATDAEGVAIARPPALVQLAASPSTAAPAGPSGSDVIGLCRAAIFDGQAARVAAALAAMPENIRQPVQVVCAAYAEGVRDARGTVPTGGVAI